MEDKLLEALSQFTGNGIGAISDITNVINKIREIEPKNEVENNIKKTLDDELSKSSVQINEALAKLNKLQDAFKNK